MELVNLVATVPGTDPELSRHPVLVMAHLDHLGRGWPDVREGNEGVIHPGADDNASGVAVLLALARALADEAPRPRGVMFAVVTGEEAGLLGSRHLLAREGLDAALAIRRVGRATVTACGAEPIRGFGNAWREHPEVQDPLGCPYTNFRRDEHATRAAVDTYRIVGCRHMARVDMLMTLDGVLNVLEINTIPGFTPISMYPMLWEASGISYRELITKLVELALERHVATRVETRKPVVEGGGGV